MNIKTKITQRTLLSLEATGAIQYVRDSELQGFGIKVTGKGKATYIVEARKRGGRNIRHQIGSVDLVSLEDARIKARDALLRLAQGEDINHTRRVEKSPHDSLAKTTERYIVNKGSRLTQSTITTYKSAIEKNFKDWLHMPVSAISEDLVLQRRTQMLSSGLSENYVNKAFRTLKAVLNISRLPFNPVSEAYKDFGLSLQSSSKDTFLEGSDIVQLMENYAFENLFRTKGDDIFAYLMFLLLTGCRRSEALYLTWGDVTEEAISFRNTKNKRVHTIANVGMISDVLDQMWLTNAHTPLVFNMTSDQCRRKMAKVFDKFRFKAHDLRRTFAEHANLAGFDDHAIGQALNHQSSNITKSYRQRQLGKIIQLKSLYIAYQRQLAYYWQVNAGKIERAPEEYDGIKSKQGYVSNDILAHFPKYLSLQEPDLLNAIENQPFDDLI